MCSTSVRLGSEAVPSPAEFLDVLKTFLSHDRSSPNDSAALDHARTLNQARWMIDAAFTQATGTIHARGAGEVDGCVSTKAWLRSQLRMSYRDTAAHVDVAASLADLPRFTALFEAGRISLDHVHALAELHKKAGPEVTRIADAALADHALEYGPTEIRRLAKLIREHFQRLRDGDDAPGGPEPEPDRFIDLAQTFDGVWSLDGALTPEAGSLLRTALDAVMRRPAPDDDRSTAQRRHDAFADLIRLAVTTGELPTKGGERPHLGVLVPLDDLRVQEARREQRSGALPEDVTAYLTAVDADLTTRSVHLDPEDPQPADARPAEARPAPADATAGAGPFAAGSAAGHIAAGHIAAGDSAAGPTAAGDGGSDRRESRLSVLAAWAPDIVSAGPCGETDDSDGKPLTDWLPPAWLPDLAASTDPPDPLQALLPGLGTDRRHLPRPGGGALTDHGGHLSPQAAQRLACDSQIHRVVLGPKGLPMNLGQRVRLVPAPMRRVIVARDRHCRFPGCEMPSAYTEVHHVRHWSAGGPTEPRNLLLVCAWHHHRVHDHRWTLRYNHRTNTVTASRPDGTQLQLPSAA
jgi:hypothetical protein